MVEAAGVEPASENTPHGYLHACPDIGYSPFWESIRQDAQMTILWDFRWKCNRSTFPAILQVVAQTGLAEMIRQDASLKRLERNYNRLRLSLFPVFFTSWQELGMQPELLYPRRSRFAPIFYPSNSPLLPNIRVRLKFRFSKYDAYSCGRNFRLPWSWPKLNHFKGTKEIFQRTIKSLCDFI